MAVHASHHVRSAIGGTAEAGAESAAATLQSGLPGPTAHMELLYRLIGADLCLGEAVALALGHDATLRLADAAEQSGELMPAAQILVALNDLYHGDPESAVATLEGVSYDGCISHALPLQALLQLKQLSHNRFGQPVQHNQAV